MTNDSFSPENPFEEPTGASSPNPTGAPPQNPLENPSANPSVNPSTNPPENSFGTEPNAAPNLNEEPKAGPEPIPEVQPEGTPGEETPKKAGGEGFDFSEKKQEEEKAEPSQKKPEKDMKHFLFVAGLSLAAVVLIVFAYFIFFYKTTLLIGGDPADVSVSVDGKDTTLPANKTLKLKPGKHSIKLSKTAYIDQTREVNLPYFKKTNLSFSLIQKPATMLVSDKSASDLTLSEDGTYLNFFAKDDASFYRLKLDEEVDGKPKLITASPAIMKNVVSISWSPDLKVAALKIKNDADALAGTPFYRSELAKGTVTTWLYDFGRYDLLNQHAYFLGSDIGGIAFSKDSEKIAYYYFPASGEKTLIIAGKTNQSKERAVNLDNFGDPKIRWSNDDHFIAITKQTTTYDQNQVYLLNVVSKELTALTDQGSSIDAKFLPLDDKIIYSVYSNDQESGVFSLLNIVDRETKLKHELSIRGYLDQLDFIDNANAIVFGIIKEERGFFKYNFTDSKTQKLQYQDTSLDQARFLTLSKDKRKVYFTGTAGIYSLLIETE